MAKMINADELIEFCNTERAMLHAHNNSVACAALRRVVEYAKEYAVEAEPVKHGRWIYGENDDGQDSIFCSECEHFVPWFYEYYDKLDDLINDNPRCPSCGSKQDLGGD